MSEAPLTTSAPALRAALNRRGIWVSLKTGYQNEARERVSLLHARTTELFSQAHLGQREPDRGTAGFAELHLLWKRGPCQFQH
ncbi:DUF6538 domain-containing protein [Zymomonas mobilis]|uniref:DUF6538 domain-containing protein n=1 Tax=Zymomonas mobilis TaxID=542 RepID=UPI003908885C